MIMLKCPSCKGSGVFPCGGIDKEGVCDNICPWCFGKKKISLSSWWHYICFLIEDAPIFHNKKRTFSFYLFSFGIWGYIHNFSPFGFHPGPFEFGRILIWIRDFIFKVGITLPTSGRLNNKYNRFIMLHLFFFDFQFWWVSKHILKSKEDWKMEDAEDV